MPDAVVGVEQRCLEVGVDTGSVEETDGGAHDHELLGRLVPMTEHEEELTQLGGVLRQRQPGDHVAPPSYGGVQPSLGHGQPSPAGERRHVTRCAAQGDVE